MEGSLDLPSIEGRLIYSFLIFVTLFICLSTLLTQYRLLNKSYTSSFFFLERKFNKPFLVPVF